VKSAATGGEVVSEHSKTDDDKSSRMAASLLSCSLSGETQQPLGRGLKVNRPTLKTPHLKLKPGSVAEHSRDGWMFAALLKFDQHRAAFDRLQPK